MFLTLVALSLAACDIPVTPEPPDAGSGQPSTSATTGTTEAPADPSTSTTGTTDAPQPSTSTTGTGTTEGPDDPSTSSTGTGTTGA